MNEDLSALERIWRISASVAGVLGFVMGIVNLIYLVKRERRDAERRQDEVERKKKEEAKRLDDLDREIADAQRELTDLNRAWDNYQVTYQDEINSTHSWAKKREAEIKTELAAQGIGRSGFFETARAKAEGERRGLQFELDRKRAEKERDWKARQDSLAARLADLRARRAKEAGGTKAGA